MNILIGILVAIISFVVILVYIAYFGKQPNYKFGKADVDSKLGEYGRLEAQLKDLENPYSGRPVIDGPLSVIAFVITVTLTILASEYISTNYGYALGAATGIIVLIVLSIFATSIITFSKRRKLLKEMDLWRKSHPKIKTDEFTTDK